MCQFGVSSSDSWPGSSFVTRRHWSTIISERRLFLHLRSIGQFSLLFLGACFYYSSPPRPRVVLVLAHVRMPRRSLLSSPRFRLTHSFVCGNQALLFVFLISGDPHYPGERTTTRIVLALSAAVCVSILETERKQDVLQMQLKQVTLLRGNRHWQRRWQRARAIIHP